MKEEVRKKRTINEKGGKIIVGKDIGREGRDKKEGGGDRGERMVGEGGSQGKGRGNRRGKG